MQHIKDFLLGISFIIISTTVFGQSEDNSSINDGTLHDQFEFIFKKSSNYSSESGQWYEVVKKEYLLAIREHVKDSISNLQKEINSLNNSVNSQLKEIEGLKTKVESTNKALTTVNEKVDSINLFGAQMSKTGYNSLMWTIIVILLAGLLFFIYKFKDSNQITQDAVKNLAKLEDEYEEHRKVALEREQKVRRQLIDEINKNKKGK